MDVHHTVLVSINFLIIFTWEAFAYFCSDCQKGTNYDNKNFQNPNSLGTRIAEYSNLKEILLGVKF